MKRIWLIFLITGFLFVQGCSSSQGMLFEEKLDDETREILIPTPNMHTGVIFGVLRSTSGELIQDGIFLSQNITYGNPDLPPTVSFSYQNSPRAMIDNDSGYFYFLEIEPAENYVLAVFVGPGELIFLKDDDGETPLQISINAGESVDLGSITVELP